MRCLMSVATGAQAGQKRETGLLAAFLFRALEVYWGAWHPKVANLLALRPFLKAVYHGRPFQSLNIVLWCTSWIGKNPTAVRAASIVQELASIPDGEFPYDHIAFRTFGANDMGIDSIAQIFLHHGFTRRDELLFPAKRLHAHWFSPPSSGLPRIFVSELQVDKLSSNAQRIIAKYVGEGCGVSREHASLSTVLAALPWARPTMEDFKALEEESEYAAWTLVNGYALNHTTLAVHRLPGIRGGIDEVNKELACQGIPLNRVGSVLKVSPDGGLLQSSTIADSMPFMFSGGALLDVPGSYIEFAERLPLPQYSQLPVRPAKTSLGHVDKLSTNVTPSIRGCIPVPSHKGVPDNAG